MIDNKIIIHYDRRTSGILPLKESESSILLTTTRKLSPVPVPIKLIRRSKEGFVSFQHYKISHGWQKIRIAPYHSVEICIDRWQGMEGDFPFQLIRGSNMELFFYDLWQNLFNFNLEQGFSGKLFTIGHHQHSNVSVFRNFNGLLVEFNISNNEFEFKRQYTVKPDSILARLFTQLIIDIKSLQEQNPDRNTPPHILNQKSEAFSRMVAKHFRPLV